MSDGLLSHSRGQRGGRRSSHQIRRRRNRHLKAQINRRVMAVGGYRSMTQTAKLMMSLHVNRRPSARAEAAETITGTWTWSGQRCRSAWTCSALRKSQKSAGAIKIYSSSRRRSRKNCIHIRLEMCILWSTRSWIRLTRSHIQRTYQPFQRGGMVGVRARGRVLRATRSSKKQHGQEMSHSGKGQQIVANPGVEDAGPSNVPADKHVVAMSASRAFLS